MIVTCTACGLRNADGEAACRRCAEPLFTAAAVGRVVPPIADTGVWRDGDVLVVRKGASLPERCVRCGGASHSRIDQTYYWHPRALYLLIFLNLLIYAVVAMVVRKKAHVQLGLCQLHAVQRQRGLIVGVATAVAFFASLMLGTQYTVMLAVALFVLLVGTVIAVRYRTLPAALLIDDSLVRLKGVDASFLLPLPPYGRFR